MKDIQAHLKKIRSDAAECLVLSSLATDGKREVFVRIAEHLNALALKLETSIKIGTDGERASKLEEIAVVNPPTADPQLQPKHMLPWLLVIVFGVVSGALIWVDSPAEKYQSFVQSKHEPTPKDNSNQALVTLLSSGERAERELLSDRVTALAGRLDDIERSLDSLKKPRAETAEPLNTGSSGAETKPPTAETSPPAPIEKPVSTAETRVSTAESPTSQKQPDQVGPPGCTQFRSFDPRSGTYVTLDGRRRPCR